MANADTSFCLPAVPAQPPPPLRLPAAVLQALSAEKIFLQPQGGASCCLLPPDPLAGCAEVASSPPRPPKCFQPPSPLHSPSARPSLQLVFKVKWIAKNFPYPPLIDYVSRSDQPAGTVCLELVPAATDLPLDQNREQVFMYINNWDEGVAPAICPRIFGTGKYSM